MKPVLVDACNHFDFGKSTCSKCGRSLPDVCLEFEQMKQKAEAYDRVRNEPAPDAGAVRVASADPSPVVPPPVPPTKRGRPKKVTNETNATD